MSSLIIDNTKPLREIPDECPIGFHYPGDFANCIWKRNELGKIAIVSQSKLINIKRGDSSYYKKYLSFIDGESIGCVVCSTVLSIEQAVQHLKDLHPEVVPIEDVSQDYLDKQEMIWEHSGKLGHSSGPIFHRSESNNVLADC
jgi:hypothetical protein